MLQENSFFSSPFIFFGENSNEQIDDEDEENFSDLLGISLDTNKTIYPLPRIGLFIHWYDISE